MSSNFSFTSAECIGPMTAQRPVWWNKTKPLNASISILYTDDGHQAILATIRSASCVMEQPPNGSYTNARAPKDASLLLNLGFDYHNRAASLQHFPLSSLNESLMLPFTKSYVIGSIDAVRHDGKRFLTFGLFCSHLAWVAEECLWELADTHESRHAPPTTFHLEGYGDIDFTKEVFDMKGYWDDKLNSQSFVNTIISKLGLSVTQPSFNTKPTFIPKFCIVNAPQENAQIY